MGNGEILKTLKLSAKKNFLLLIANMYASVMYSKAILNHAYRLFDDK